MHLTAHHMVETLLGHRAPEPRFHPAKCAERTLGRARTCRRHQKQTKQGCGNNFRTSGTMSRNVRRTLSTLECSYCRQKKVSSCRSDSESSGYRETTSSSTTPLVSMSENCLYEVKRVDVKKSPMLARTLSTAAKNCTRKNCSVLVCVCGSSPSSYRRGIFRWRGKESGSMFSC